MSMSHNKLKLIQYEHLVVWLQEIVLAARRVSKS